MSFTRLIVITALVKISYKRSSLPLLEPVVFRCVVVELG